VQRARPGAAIDDGGVLSETGKKASRNTGPGRIHGATARDLGIAILSGKHAPGDVLPNEINASVQLGISRTAYREAVRILAAKGLVESQPKTGTRVNPRSRWSLLDPDVLAWTFATEPDEDFLTGLFELRLMVEPAAAGFAAERRDDAQLERMRNALIQMQQHTVLTEAGQEADRTFHETVLEATRNEPLATLASSISEAVRWTTIYNQRDPGAQRDTMPDKWKVFDGIAAQRPDQARAAMEHLVKSSLAVAMPRKGG